MRCRIQKLPCVTHLRTLGAVCFLHIQGQLAAGLDRRLTHQNVSVTTNAFGSLVTRPRPPPPPVLKPVVAVVVVGQTRSLNDSLVSKRWFRAVGAAVKHTQYTIFTDTDDNIKFSSLLDDKMLFHLYATNFSDVGFITRGREIQWERHTRVWRVITEYERSRSRITKSYQFDIVLKVRPDLFFFTPLPNLQTLQLAANDCMAPVVAVRGSFVSRLNLTIVGQNSKPLAGCSPHATKLSQFDCVTINDQVAIMGREAAKYYFDFHPCEHINAAARCFVSCSSEEKLTSSLLNKNVSLKAL